MVPIFYILCNLGTRIFFFRFRELEEKDTRCLYVIKTAPESLIISFSLPRVCRLCRVLRQNSYVPPITLCVQANKQECGQKFQSM